VSYSSGEALALTRIRACTGFDTTNTSRSDWKILNGGKSDHYAVLHLGAFTQEWISPRVYKANWQTVIEIWQRYKDETTTPSNLYTHIANIMAGLAPYRKLGDTTNVIEDANTRSGGAIEEMWQRKNGAGPQWLKWDLLLEWSEEVTVNYSE
jgi:hypothetical protein